MRAAGSSYRQINAECGLFKSTSSYSAFFRNRLYIGELQFGDQTLKEYCEPMITKETWDKVQEKNRTNKTAATKTANHPRRKNSNYLLSGLVYCTHCGAPLNGHTIKSQKSGTWYYYKCSRSKRGAGCDAPNIPRRALENQVVSTVIEYILIPENLDQISKQINALNNLEPETLQATQKQIQTALTQKTAQIEKILDTIENAGHNPRLLQRLSEREAEEEQLKTDLVRITQQIENPPNLPTFEDLEKLSIELTNRIKTADKDELRTILNALIEKILVELDEDILRGTITYYYAYELYPHGDSNPGFSLERATS